jgi:CTP synthase (UTP-ammonia lyase)
MPRPAAPPPETLQDAIDELIRDWDRIRTSDTCLQEIARHVGRIETLRANEAEDELEHARRHAG